MDSFESYKATQKRAWPGFAPLEAFTTAPAWQLVKRARIHPGDRVLDVACGTGVVSVSAARCGARVSGLDLTPELLERARENAAVSELEIEFLEGDAEALPFANEAFDVVLSQFGHMFAPRPDVAIAEMLRVLKPGGTLAFSTWPPELFTGRAMTLIAQYVPLPPGVPSPIQWGDTHFVRERLGTAVKDVAFDRLAGFMPALSPRHHRRNQERLTPAFVRAVASLSESDPAQLEELRREYEAIVSDYWEANLVTQGYLITRAVKV